MITKTDWHNVAVFGEVLRDSVMATVSKGQRVHISGRIMYGRIEDRAGVIRYAKYSAVRPLCRKVVKMRIWGILPAGRPIM